MTVKTRVRDQRKHGWFPVYRADLEALSESCDRRKLVYARSVYFALLEAANDNRADFCEMTRKELAARASIGNSTFSAAVEALIEAGLLEVESGKTSGTPNVWTLLGGEEGGVRDRGHLGVRDTREGVDAIAVTPYVPSEKSKQVPPNTPGQISLDPEEEARVDRFMAWFRTRIEQHRGEPMAVYKTKDREAARDILRLHPDSVEVAAVLECALEDHRWFATKVKTVPTFKRFYGDVRAKWIGQKKGREQAKEIAARRNGKVDTSVTAPDYPVEADYSGGAA